MATVVEKIALARQERDAAEAAFRTSLREGRANGMSWSQLAAVAGLSMHGVRYLTLNLNEQRKQLRKGEKNGHRGKGKAAH